RRAHLEDLPRGAQIGSGHGDVDLVAGDGSSTTAVLVDGRPTGNGVDPRSELLGGVEGRRRPPRLHEGELRGVRGRVVVAEDAQGNGEHRTSVAVVDRLEGSLVAHAESFEDLAFQAADCGSAAN